MGYSSQECAKDGTSSPRSPSPSVKSDSNASTTTINTKLRRKPKSQRPNSSECWISRLFHLMLQQESLHVESKRKLGYRNKITYSIPLVELSPLAQDDINRVCQYVNQCNPTHFWFREVMVKATRSGELMVRVTIQPKDIYVQADVGIERESVIEEEMRIFAHASTQTFPCIKCICYNVSYDRSRPTKDATLHMLTSQFYVMEQIPTTPFEYQVSPDAFCEVNHEVEFLQYLQTSEWIQQQKNKNAILLCSGRDINSFGLGFGTLVSEDGTRIFKQVVAVQHCPLVHADALANFERNSHHLQVTLLHCTKSTMAPSVAKAVRNALDSHDSTKVMVVTTGGRKGLDPSYLQYLCDNTQIECIIYNSCSTKSLIKDMHPLIASGKYVIKDFKSFDFFPDCSHIYQASLTLLIRRPPKQKVLILPIGPAGVGKTTLARSLAHHLKSYEFGWWQRDQVFATLRRQGTGLNKTKSLVHHHLLDFLQQDSPVLFIDSTNGSTEARQLYVEKSNANCVVMVEMRPQMGSCEETVLWLLRRTASRLEGGHEATDEFSSLDQSLYHPSFPTTVDDQRSKHENILLGLEYPSNGTNHVEGPETTVIKCNPVIEEDSLALPFDICVELFVSNDRLKALICKNELSRYR